MTGVFDLPQELLLRILNELGDGAQYSDKERQRNLERLAPVCRAFAAVALHLLYGDTVNVRSAGRMHLLARTLSTSPDLAAAVNNLVLKPTIDAGHVPSAVALLQHTPNLTSLELGETLFLRLDAPAMQASLAAKRLRRFSYGFGMGATSLVDLAPLLRGWADLEHLELRNVLVATERDRAEGRTGDGLRSAIPPNGTPFSLAPPYALERLEVVSDTGATRPIWTLAAIDWVLGRTYALTSLVLVNFHSSVDLPDLFTALVLRGCGPTVRRLCVRQYTHVDTAAPETVSSHAVVDPNALDCWFPSLTHLALEENTSQPGFLTCVSTFVPSHKLRVLELYGEKLYQGFKLGEMLATDKRVLGKIKLAGPSPTNPEVKALRRACEANGVWLEVARVF